MVFFPIKPARILLLTLIAVNAPALVTRNAPVPQAGSAHVHLASLVPDGSDLALVFQHDPSPIGRAPTVSEADHRVALRDVYFVRPAGTSVARPSVPDSIEHTMTPRRIATPGVVAPALRLPPPESGPRLRCRICVFLL